ncbi:hypothetical protein PV773_18400 [Mesorhizobium sp. CC13]|uniref:hypothetical protein n=1 Tax=Mesorhizobium sp. CC13 TaxID=3029194 RepID=UPI0032636FC5
MEQQQGRSSTRPLTHFFLLLLSTFAVLTAAIASSQAGAGVQIPVAHLTATAEDAGHAETVLTAVGPVCNTASECQIHGLDHATPTSVHALSSGVAGEASFPTIINFGLLRGRTSAPRAPPHLV